MKIIFEWDKNKAAMNLRDHKVSFDEAKTVFSDDFAITFRDEFHSDEEDRFLTLGVSDKNRVLLVVNTENQLVGDSVIIRIISSRKATRHERKKYEKGD